MPDAMLCDASILVPLFAPEPASTMIEAFFREAPRAILVSDFAIGEFASAISAKVRTGVFDDGLAEPLFIAFDSWIQRDAQRVATEPRDIGVAAELVRRHRLALRMPDAMYLALAIRLNTPLVTLDRHQASAALALRVALIDPSQS